MTPSPCCWRRALCAAYAVRCAGDPSRERHAHLCHEEQHGATVLVDGKAVLNPTPSWADGVPRHDEASVELQSGARRIEVQFASLSTPAPRRCKALLFRHAAASAWRPTRAKTLLCGPCCSVEGASEAEYTLRRLAKRSRFMERLCLHPPAGRGCEHSVAEVSDQTRIICAHGEGGPAWCRLTAQCISRGRRAWSRPHLRRDDARGLRCRMRSIRMRPREFPPNELRILHADGEDGGTQCCPESEPER